MNPGAHQVGARLRKQAGDLAAVVDREIGALLEPGSPVALVGFGSRNPGDSAIWEATRSTLGRLGIPLAYASPDLPEYAERSLRRAHPDGAVLLAGGGNLGTLYPPLQARREQILRELDDRPVVQLPQSIHLDRAGAGARTGEAMRRHPRFTLLVRDGASQAIAERDLGVPARRCPDLAVTLPAPARAHASGSILWLARADHERSGVLPSSAADVVVVDWMRSQSFLLESGWKAARLVGLGKPRASRRLSLRLATLRTRWALRLVAGAAVVVTERLHGHILCLVAGVPHVLVPDAKGKLLDFAETWGTLGPGVAVATRADDALDRARSLAVAHPPVDA